MPVYETNDEKGKYHWKFADYIGDVIQQNQEAQKRKEKIKEGALGRQVGAIPTSVFRSWQVEFEAQGGKKNERWVDDWKVFLWRKLQLHPEYRTVEKLRTDNHAEGHIFIR